MTSTTTRPKKAKPAYQPVRKVTAGVFTGAFVTLAVLILNTYHPFFQTEDKKISGEISGAATTVLTFIVSYLIPPGRKETLTEGNEVINTTRK